MKSHQKIMREKIALQETESSLFGPYLQNIDVDINKAELCQVSIRSAKEIIKKYEYLGTMCNAPMFAYGIHWDGQLAGVVVYGSPSPPIIAKSVVGEELKSKVIQLGRGACVHWAHPHAGSKLIAYSLREIKKLGYKVVVAFTDPDAGEIGTLYQATNWLYAGLTAVRPDYIDANGKRVVGHFKKGQASKLIKVPRTRKGRYVYILGNKTDKKNYYNSLKWPIEQYPKRIINTTPKLQDSFDDSIDWDMYD